MNVSIVIPVFNEQGNLQPLYDRLRTILEEDSKDFEILFVDDGSRDNSCAEIRQLHARDARVRMLSFSRNFGHQTALTAGMDHARGDAVICLDADHQHPPELIRELLRRWREGHEIVYAVRVTDPEASFLKRLAASLFYRVFRRLSGIDLPSNTADFRLLDRKVIDAFAGIRERNRFLRGLTSWTGFRSVSVPYSAGPRHEGRSKYTWRRQLELALNGLVAFSPIPLYAAVYLGLLFSCFGAGYALFAIYARFVTHQVLPGWTSLMVFLALLGGLQLLVMGVIGIYIGKMYEEVKQRPLYLIRDWLGFEETPS